MLAQRLKEIRKKFGFTQEDLAHKLNLTKGTISNYENGHSTPSNELLVLLADVLETTTDYLLGRAEMTTETMIPELNQLYQEHLTPAEEKFLLGSLKLFREVNNVGN